MVDDFIDRIMVDPRLDANPRFDGAPRRVTAAGFKYLATEMLRWAAGWPQSCSGRAMDETHCHLLISSGEWQAFMKDLQQTLDKLVVPESEQTEITGTRSAIVVG